MAQGLAVEAMLSMADLIRDLATPPQICADRAAKIRGHGSGRIDQAIDVNRITSFGEDFVPASVGLRTSNTS